MLGLMSEFDLRVSLRHHPEIARRAIEKGANWINDVTGLENSDMQQVVLASQVDTVIMHSLSIPTSLHPRALRAWNQINGIVRCSH
jgi:dihydropteroate synthase